MHGAYLEKVWYNRDIGNTLSGYIGYTSEIHVTVSNEGQGLFSGLFRRVVEAVPAGVGA